MKKLVEILKNKGYTIACCESLTGGLFASKMTEIPGVSQVFKGGIVTYWNEIKVDVANVRQSTIDEFGVVSSQTAREMAENVRKIFNCNVGVSFTGNAGPDCLEGKPKGMVYTCIVINDSAHDFMDIIDLPRNEMRSKIVELTTERAVELLMNNR